MRPQGCIMQECSEVDYHASRGFLGGRKRCQLPETHDRLTKDGIFRSKSQVCGNDDRPAGLDTIVPVPDPCQSSSW